MNMKFFVFLLTIFQFTCAYYLNYDNEMTKSLKKSILLEDDEFEPVTTFLMQNTTFKNINCEDFSKYAINCTVDAAIIYNSSRMAPPLPSKISDWCRAIKHLTNCAIDWNADCSDVTESHFNEESIKGHIHVVNNVCDDEWFLIRYEELPLCVESSTDSWESCYIAFKNAAEEQKNTTQEWTHYTVHFELCCARARFRRCTLESLFLKPTFCTQEQAVTLQKFSVIVSEGGVYQDCDRNMMYANCPGGDPRPTTALLKRLMSAETRSRGTMLCDFWIALYIILYFTINIQFFVYVFLFYFKILLFCIDY